MRYVARSDRQTNQVTSKLDQNMDIFLSYWIIPADSQSPCGCEIIQVTLSEPEYFIELYRETCVPHIYSLMQFPVKALNHILNQSVYS